jgi:hypothetical protein
LFSFTIVTMGGMASRGWIRGKTFSFHFIPPPQKAQHERGCQTSFIPSGRSVARRLSDPAGRPRRGKLDECPFTMQQRWLAFSTPDEGLNLFYVRPLNPRLPGARVVEVSPHDGLMVVIGCRGNSATWCLPHAPFFFFFFFLFLSC